MTGTVNLDGLDALHTDRGGWCSHDGQGWPCTTSALVAEVRRQRAVAIGANAVLAHVEALCDKADEAHADYLDGVILDRFVVPAHVTTEALRRVLDGGATDPQTQEG